MKNYCACFLLLLFPASLFVSCASRGSISAEEYFSIGMAYYDLGKYAEAEQWLNRAKAKDRTMSASEYNLGRIAFETGRYEDAVRHFESILKRDPGNVLALKAAAYTRIRMGDIEKASAHYGKLLALVPESADDGYNYALVLFAMKRYAEAEQVLKSHEFALLDNNDVLLLYARAQKEQGKVEAIDTYASWLANSNDGKVRYEYAQILESHEMYARALDEYRSAHETIAASSTDPSKPGIRFSIARLLLIAESDKADGIGELEAAAAEGFADIEAMEALLLDERISAANRNSIQAVIAEKRRAAEAAAEPKESSDESGTAADSDGNSEADAEQGLK